MGIGAAAKVDLLTRLTGGLAGVGVALQAHRPTAWIAASPEATVLQEINVAELSRLVPGASDPVSRIWREAGRNRWVLDLENRRLAEPVLELHRLAYARLLEEADEATILSSYDAIFPASLDVSAAEALPIGCWVTYQGKVGWLEGLQTVSGTQGYSIRLPQGSSFLAINQARERGLRPLATREQVGRVWSILDQNDVALLRPGLWAQARAVIPQNLQSHTFFGDIFICAEVLHDLQLHLATARYRASVVGVRAIGDFNRFIKDVEDFQLKHRGRMSHEIPPRQRWKLEVDVARLRGMLADNEATRQRLDRERPILPGIDFEGHALRYERILADELAIVMHLTPERVLAMIHERTTFRCMMLEAHYRMHRLDRPSEKQQALG